MTLFPGGKGITRELLKVGVGPVSLDHAASLLGDPGEKQSINPMLISFKDRGLCGKVCRL